MAALLTLISLTPFCIVQCAAYSDSTAHMSEVFLDTRLDDVRFSTDIVFEFPADRDIHCGILCSRHSSCLTFTFHQGQCQGHSAIMTSASAHTVAMGAKSFATSGSSRCIGDGVHLFVDPSLNVKVTVLCEADWLVVQRRQDGSVDFERGWEDYKNGFGKPTGELWLGLETMHRLTSGQPWELQVTLGDWEGNVTYANYNNFSISSAADNFTLYADYLEDRSQVNDSLARNSGYQFTTYDADNDIQKNINCANKLNGGWWFVKCGDSNLNGLYMNSSDAPDTNGVRYKQWLGTEYSLKFAQMKIRPVQGFR
ncbi:microfibril-associated glycoprotein 4-like [Littorina saxatilis]|uniref:Fibrinogen C-terminal domain-containing protein n=1 Tax=Littorina saxatilis TaxID=31220 RepID=A0AAN9GEP6_9CAEN